MRGNYLTEKDDDSRLSTLDRKRKSEEKSFSLFRSSKLLFFTTEKKIETIPELRASENDKNKHEKIFARKQLCFRNNKL